MLQSELLLSKVKSRAATLLYLVAALKNASTLNEAYNAEHYIEGEVNAIGELLDQSPEGEIFTIGDVKHFPPIVVIVEQGKKALKETPAE